MQMSASRREAAAPSQAPFSFPHKSLKRRGCEKRRVKEQVAAEFPPFVFTVFFSLPNLTGGWAGVFLRGRRGRSLSLSEASVLLGLLYCSGGKLPIPATLIEQ